MSGVTKLRIGMDKLQVREGSAARVHRRQSDWLRIERREEAHGKWLELASRYYEWHSMGCHDIVDTNKREEWRNRYERAEKTR
ncbi:hypothetical protein KIH86_24675 [Paenibacillus sp. HN-1]|nr:hypothetical protein [Paenibacillus sp. CGMCC 1.18879]MBY9087384.1 hypothetical protein [Paenibacillus sinensis]